MIHFTFFRTTRRFAQERILKIKKSQSLESKSKPTRAISGQQSAVSSQQSAVSGQQSVMIVMMIAASFEAGYFSVFL